MVVATHLGMSRFRILFCLGTCLEISKAATYPTWAKEKTLTVDRPAAASANATGIAQDASAGVLYRADQQVRTATSRQEPLNETLPSGAAIWSHNVTWENITRWHPTGLVSNTNHGEIIFNDVSYMSLRALLVLSWVCWPAIVVAVIMSMTITCGLCLSTKPQAELDGGSVEAASSDERPHNQADLLGSSLPVLRLESLTEVSQRVYKMWVWFCCCIPSIFVFGLPVVLVGLSRPYPQEVFSMLSLMTGMMMFSNGIWVVIFGGSSIIRMRYCMRTSYGKLLKDSAAARSPSSSEKEVSHWVILPQYKEELETVSMALQSIASSGIAKTNIGVVLGMEEREAGAAEKAAELRRNFEDQFADMLDTYHPPDLPNDPPGKASNTAWCFKRLLEHRASKKADPDAPVILTIADADSEFHAEYFEGLSLLYHQAEASRRNNIIWQSPVFHVKNYHRQPYPIIVGTMFTCMQELAALSDPHSIRFPYSTYSLTLDLARRVGGWDPEWIAEDWHMGIKCFLMTMGQSRVEPMLLPCANYTPEDRTWWKTIMARWAQAKRHALGFSDVAYYFMMLPLVLGYAMSKDSAMSKDRIQALRQVWYMIFQGLTLVIRLTNVHVIIGLLMTYGALGIALKGMMILIFLQERNVNLLFDKMHFNVVVLTFSSITCMTVTTLLFNAIYVLLKDRMEGKAFSSLLVHWCYSVIAFVVFGPIYFLGLGFAVWKAALSMLVQTSFEYEVAAKPTAGKRMY